MKVTRGANSQTSATEQLITSICETLSWTNVYFWGELQPCFDYWTVRYLYQYTASSCIVCMFYACLIEALKGDSGDR